MTDKEWLAEKVESISSEPLRSACRHMLSDERFFVAPAAATKHQAHTGGLAQHTREVMDIALAMASAECVKGTVSTDVIIAAVLWHDYAKIWDYKRNPEYVSDNVKVDENGMKTSYLGNDGPYVQEWVYDRHRWTIRHLSRSYAEFYKTAMQYSVPEQEIEEVSHCLLSHHGRHEWGSPVTPLSTEASIIHFADCIDAFHVGKPHIFRVPDGPKKDWKTPGSGRASD